MTGLHSHLPALQVIVPMLTAPLVMLLRQPRLSWVVASAASICAFAISIALTVDVLADRELKYLMGSWPAPWGIELRVDAFSVLVLLIVTGASSLALLAGAKSLDRDIGAARQPLFYAAWLLALAGLAGILHATRFGSGRADSGEPLLLSAIAAVVVGGASLFGGSGTIFWLPSIDIHSPLSARAGENALVT